MCVYIHTYEGERTTLYTTRLERVDYRVPLTAANVLYFRSPFPRCRADVRTYTDYTHRVQRVSSTRKRERERERKRERVYIQYHDDDDLSLSPRESGKTAGPREFALDSDDDSRLTIARNDGRTDTHGHLPLLTYTDEAYIRLYTRLYG